MSDFDAMSLGSDGSGSELSESDLPPLPPFVPATDSPYTSETEEDWQQYFDEMSVPVTTDGDPTNQQGFFESIYGPRPEPGPGAAEFARFMAERAGTKSQPKAVPSVEPTEEEKRRREESRAEMLRSFARLDEQNLMETVARRVELLASPTLAAEREETFRWKTQEMDDDVASIDRFERENESSHRVRMSRLGKFVPPRPEGEDDFWRRGVQVVGSTPALTTTTTTPSDQQNNQTTTTTTTNNATQERPIKRFIDEEAWHKEQADAEDDVEMGDDEPWPTSHEERTRLLERERQMQRILIDARHKRRCALAAKAALIEKRMRDQADAAAVAGLPALKAPLTVESVMEAVRGLSREQQMRFYHGTKYDPSSNEKEEEDENERAEERREQKGKGKETGNETEKQAGRV